MAKLHIVQKVTNVLVYLLFLSTTVYSVVGPAPDQEVGQEGQTYITPCKFQKVPKRNLDEPSFFLQLSGSPTSGLSSTFCLAVSSFTSGLNLPMSLLSTVLAGTLFSPFSSTLLGSPCWSRATSSLASSLFSLLPRPSPLSSVSAF